MRLNGTSRAVGAALLSLAISSFCFAAGQQQAAVDTKDVTLKVIFRNTAAYEPGSEVQRELERILGFKLEFDARPMLEYVQATQAVLASGVYPDLMEAWFANANLELKNLAEDGVIIPLDDLLDKYGRNIKEARPNEGNWYRPLADKKTYSIQARFNGYGFEYGWLVRQDWLDKLGLKVPTTLAEFKNVAKAFTFNDPDGNGKKDTYGVDAGWPANARSSLFEYVLSAYGVMMGHWQEVNGELVHWTVHPGTLQALKFMRELYAEGVVDPEFALMQRPQWLEAMRAGRYGMQWWWNTHLDKNTSAWWNEFTAAQPNAKISFIPPAAGPGGKQQIPGSGSTGYMASLVVFKNAKPANQVAAIRLIDYLASEEGAKLGAFGIEGKHWSMKDGSLVSNVSGTEQQAKAGTYLFGWIFRRNNVMPTSALAFKNVDVYSKFVVRPIFEEQVPTEVEFSGVLNELTNSRFLKIQTEAGINADAEYQDFVKTWLNAGGKAMTDQKNAAWKAIRK